MRVKSSIREVFLGLQQRQTKDRAKPPGISEAARLHPPQALGSSPPSLSCTLVVRSSDFHGLYPSSSVIFAVGGGARGWSLQENQQVSAQSAQRLYSIHVLLTGSSVARRSLPRAGSLHLCNSPSQADSITLFPPTGLGPPLRPARSTGRR